MEIMEGTRRAGEGRVSLVPASIAFKDWGSDMVRGAATATTGDVSSRCSVAVSIPSSNVLAATSVPRCLIGDFLACISNVQSNSSWKRQLLVVNRSLHPAAVVVMAATTARFKVTPVGDRVRDCEDGRYFEVVVRPEESASFEVVFTRPGPDDEAFMWDDFQDSVFAYLSSSPSGADVLETTVTAVRRGGIDEDTELYPSVIRKPRVPSGATFSLDVAEPLDLLAPDEDPTQDPNWKPTFTGGSFDGVVKTPHTARSVGSRGFSTARLSSFTSASGEGFGIAQASDRAFVPPLAPSPIDTSMESPGLPARGPPQPHRVVRVNTQEDAAAVLTQLRKAMSRSSSMTPNASTPAAAVARVETARSLAQSVVSVEEWNSIQQQALRSKPATIEASSRRGSVDSDDDSSFYAGLMSDAPKLQDSLRKPHSRAAKPSPLASAGRRSLEPRSEVDAPESARSNRAGRPPLSARSTACDKSHDDAEAVRNIEEHDSSSDDDAPTSAEQGRDSAEHNGVPVSEAEMDFYRGIMGVPSPERPAPPQSRVPVRSRRTMPARGPNAQAPSTNDTPHGVAAERTTPQAGKVESVARAGAEDEVDWEKLEAIALAAEVAKLEDDDIPAPRGPTHGKLDMALSPDQDADDDIDWSEVTRQIDADIKREHRQKATGVSEADIAENDDGLGLSDDEVDPIGLRVTRKRPVVRKPLPNDKQLDVSHVKSKVGRRGLKAGTSKDSRSKPVVEQTQPSITRKQWEDSGFDLGLGLSDEEKDPEGIPVRKLGLGMSPPGRLAKPRRSQERSSRVRDSSRSHKRDVNSSSEPKETTRRGRAASEETPDWVKAEYQKRLERTRAEAKKSDRLARPTAAQRSRQLAGKRDTQSSASSSSMAHGSMQPSRPPGARRRAADTSSAPTLPRPGATTLSPGRSATGSSTSALIARREAAKPGGANSPPRVIRKPGQRMRVVAPRSRARR